MKRYLSFALVVFSLLALMPVMQDAPMDLDQEVVAPVAGTSALQLAATINAQPFQVVQELAAPEAPTTDARSGPPSHDSAWPTLQHRPGGYDVLKTPHLRRA